MNNLFRKQYLVLRTRFRRGQTARFRSPAKSFASDFFSIGGVLLFPPLLILNSLFASLGYLYFRFPVLAFAPIKWVHSVWYLCTLPIIICTFSLVALSRWPFLILIVYAIYKLFVKFTHIEWRVAAFTTSLAVVLCTPSFWYYNKGPLGGNVPDGWGWQELFVKAQNQDLAIIVKCLTSYIVDEKEYIAFTVVPLAVMRDSMRKFPAAYSFALTEPNRSRKLWTGSFSQGLTYDDETRLLWLANHAEGKLVGLDPVSLEQKRIENIATDAQTVFKRDEPNRMTVVTEGSFIFEYNTSTTPFTLLSYGYTQKNYFGLQLPVYLMDAVSVPGIGTAVASLVPYTTWLIADTEGKYVRDRKVGAFAWGLDYSRRTKALYYSDGVLGIVYKVNSLTLQIMDWKYLGGGLRPVAVDDNLGVVYVARFLGEELYQLDSNTLDILAVYNVPTGVRDIEILQKGGIAIGSAEGVYFRLVTRGSGEYKRWLDYFL